MVDEKAAQTLWETILRKGNFIEPQLKRKKLSFEIVRTCKIE